MKWELVLLLEVLENFRTVSFLVSQAALLCSIHSDSTSFGVR